MSFKKMVEARMAKTGEGWQQASDHVRAKVRPRDRVAEDAALMPSSPRPAAGEGVALSLNARPKIGDAFAATRDMRRMFEPIDAIRDMRRMFEPVDAIRDMRRTLEPLAAMCDMQRAFEPFAAIREMQRAFDPPSIMRELQQALDPFAKYRAFWEPFADDDDSDEGAGPPSDLE